MGYVAAMPAAMDNDVPQGLQVLQMLPWRVRSEVRMRTCVWRRSSTFKTSSQKLKLSIGKSLTSWGRELLDASELKGGAVKKRTDVQRMADANRAFSHYDW
jgi:hypothetical protein